MEGEGSESRVPLRCKRLSRLQRRLVQPSRDQVFQCEKYHADGGVRHRRIICDCHWLKLVCFFILISHASIGKQAQNAPCKVDIYTSVTPR